MPSVCGFTWPDWLDTIIINKSRQHGVPLDLSYAFIAVESGFDWMALGDAGCSDGLLQLNRCGGQGTGYTREQLIIPEVNLDIGLPPIAAAFRRFWSPTIDPFEYILQVMLNSGHPCNTPDTWCYPLPDGTSVRCSDPRSGCYASVVRAFNIWQCMFNAIVSSLPPGEAMLPPAPVITDSPGSIPPPPWPTPVIAPLQPGQPIVVPAGSDASVAFWLLIIAAGAYLVLRPTIYKKVIIKQPIGPVKITKKRLSE